MKYMLIAMLLIACAGYSQTGEQLLKQSAENISALRSISYNIYADQYGEKLTADVTINRKKQFPIFEIAQVKFTGIALNEQGSTQISFASDGNTFEYFDVKSNTVNRMDSPTESKLGRTGLVMYMLLVMPPYIQEKPFGPIFQTLKQAEIKEDTTIYDVPCYKIKLSTEHTHPVAGVTRSETFWYLGKNDLLIRGLSSKYGSKFLKVKNTNHHYADDYFRLAPATEVKKVTGTEPLNEGLLKPGTPAPDWTLPGVTGQLTLSKLKGKVVLLDFWGTWCVPCIKAMPHIQAIYDHFKGKNVEVIGVSVETENTDPVGFMKRNKFTYPIALNGRTITKDYKVMVFPSIYIIDKNGKIVHAEYGSREGFQEDIIKRIEKELEK